MLALEKAAGVNGNPAAKTAGQFACSLLSYVSLHLPLPYDIIKEKTEAGLRGLGLGEIVEKPQN